MDDGQARRIAEFIAPLKVAPGSEVVLSRDFDPADTGDFVHEEDSKALLAQGVDFLAHFQSRLAAQDTYGVLVVLQALDAGGKDSTIRHVMSGVNPQGVHVAGFKVPSTEDARPRLPVALCRQIARAR
jgi:polyphosphate kinase 2 (PPK2 family)